LQTVTLGGGCYWCLEAFYQRVIGVESIISGYAGGHVDNPSVDRVYKGDTGHAEVVQLTFDPSVISLTELLEIFFVMHDPTTVDRQGHDVGDEYRSIILYNDATQQQIAEEMAQGFAADLYADPIVTQIVPLEAFWPAAEYMQDFYERNPNQGYCMAIIDPKIQKLRQKFAAKLKSTE
jgi:peptide-methionine (S)-S-oxide reductase